jgi:hypothetical protein
MNRVRFSMTSLLLAVPLFAVTAAAFRFASDVWSSLLATGVVLSLPASVLAAIYSTGSRRAFWIGFALFGTSYWWMAHGPWNYAQTISGSFTSSLNARIEPQVVVRPANPNIMGRTPGGMNSDQVWEVLRTVCDSWVTVALSFVGGFVAQYIASRQTQATS